MADGKRKSHTARADAAPVEEPHENWMKFSDANGVVGKLDWSDGTLRFEGSISKSANELFEFLKAHIDVYIAQGK